MEAKGHGGDYKEIVEVLVANRADTKSIENRTTVDIRIFNLTYYHRVEFLVKME